MENHNEAKEAKFIIKPIQSITSQNKEKINLS